MLKFSAIAEFMPIMASSFPLALTTAVFFISSGLRVKSLQGKDAGLSSSMRALLLRNGGVLFRGAS
ncbi:MAG: hypothetical protein KDD06_20470, partial [Phaeodactylibacter sp.]|nr:hypothetical protein [Phaeodactylibacter sp.]